MTIRKRLAAWCEAVLCAFSLGGHDMLDVPFEEQPECRLDYRLRCPKCGRVEERTLAGGGA
jgi:hypothetical protein